MNFLLPYYENLRYIFIVSQVEVHEVTEKVAFSHWINSRNPKSARREM